MQIVIYTNIYQKYWIHRERSAQELVWHYDNASPHTAALAVDLYHKKPIQLDFVHKKPIQLVTDPPYSPDLAPRDFFLFSTIKEKLRGTKSDTRNKFAISI